ncbi:cytochrome P450 monooxygenase BOT4 [Podospora fimiseda]|uniref:Cytochrome P450 monooxygenase BOT4 n=1 Tax=Podospora fimiseda TaxID=252190 RepID=A0AAN6YLT6_9PEZI|nr:cytochrome P450 monooxygenase BOT4 [Podospora fimiseda]
MSHWYEMVTLDIMGELSFGKSFNSVEDGKHHSWSKIIEEIPYMTITMNNVRRIPFLWQIFRLISGMMGVQSANLRYAREKVEERLQENTDRPDFITPVIQAYRAGKITKEEVSAHTSTIALGGGETLSTFYTAATYFLIRNPSCLSKLQQEIDSAFSSYNKITAAKAQTLPYLQAVINESLRIFPLASAGIF